MGIIILVIIGAGFIFYILTKKNNIPPKTTLQNYSFIPHLRELLLWFLKNDGQIRLIISPTIKYLFQEGYRPITNEENDPNLLEKEAKKNGESLNLHMIEEWLIIRTWMDITAAKNISKEQAINLEKSIKLRIDLLNEYSTDTLITTGDILIKYNLDSNVKNLDEELSKIKSQKEKEKFKQNYLADILISTEIRILAWIYKELFSKEYKLPSD